MKKIMKLSLCLVAMAFTAAAQLSDTTVYSTTNFNTYAAGDLDNTADWVAVSLSGSNAFDVVSAGTGTNVLDTTAASSNGYDTVEGNAVYLDRPMSNEEDDVVEGHIELVIKCDTRGGADGDGVNDGVLEWGLTGNTTNSIQLSGAAANTSACFHLGIRFGMNIWVGFEDYLTDSDSTRLAYIQRTEADWNPNLDTWNSGPVVDLETDVLRLGWKIRKTRDAGVYQAAITYVSNMTDNVEITRDASWIDYRLQNRGDIYDAAQSLFALSHSFAAQGDNTSMYNVEIRDLAVSHRTGEKPTPVAPAFTSVVAGDRSVILEWDDHQEDIGFSLFNTTGGETYTLLDQTNATSFTDAPRWNDQTNTYVLRVHYDSDLSSTQLDSAPVEGVPQSMISLVDMDGYRQDLLSGGTGHANVDISGQQTNTIDGVFYLDRTVTPLVSNGETYGNGDTYHGPTFHALIQRTDTSGGLFLANAAGHEGYRIERDGDRSQQKFFVGSISYNNATRARLLKYVELSDMDWDGAAQSSLDVTDQLMSGVVGISHYSGGGGPLKLAIRNGSDWYVSEQEIATPSAGSDQQVRVPDFEGATWYELDVEVTNSMTIASSELADNSVLTNVNAVGYFHGGITYFTVNKFEVSTMGAKPSYEYWVENTDPALTVGVNDGAEDDPDGDGLSNRQEYAYGTNPMVADAGDEGIPVLDTEAIHAGPGGVEYITYVYKKNRDPASGLDYTVKTTTDMINGDAESNEGVWCTTNALDGGETPIDYSWSWATNYIPFGDVDKTFIKQDL